jgi:hypothetical protein
VPGRADLAADGSITVGDISFAQLQPIPAQLVLTAATTTLGTAGQRLQLMATASYPGGGQADVTAVPPRYFREHEAFAGQPQRAVAAWAAHAAGRGVPASRIPEALARPARWRTASPRLLSPGHGIYLAGALARVGLGAEQQLGHGR